MTKLIKKLLIFFIKSIKLILGYNEVCIYPISCGNYAKHLIETKPLWKAIPLIIFRILSCNPITVLIKKYLLKKSY